MQLILTSNFPLPGNERVAEYMQQVVGFSAVDWVAPAAAADRFREARAQFSSYGLTDVRELSPTTEPVAVRAIHRATYLSGGDPIAFRAALAHSPLSNWLVKSAPSNHVVVAASGGAMQLTVNVSLFRLFGCELVTVLSERASFESLGLVPFEILPHFNRHSPEFIATVQRYSERVANDIWCISDGSAVVQTSRGKVAAIGNALLLRAGSFL